jgi:hypothetical protein
VKLFYYIIDLIRDNIATAIILFVAKSLYIRCKPVLQQAWGVALFLLGIVLLWLNKIGIIKITPTLKQSLQFTLLIVLAFTLINAWLDKQNESNVSLPRHQND